MEYVKFSEWIKSREASNGRPHAPRGMNKIAEKGEKSPGSRSIEDDLSKDYKGHIADNGEVEPFSLIKKQKSKSVAPVAK